MDATDDTLRLSEPDLGAGEMGAVLAAMRAPRLSAGPCVAAFEAALARYVGRRQGIALSSGTAALTVALRALGIGPGDEVVASAYSWHQIAHAIGHWPAPHRCLPISTTGRARLRPRRPRRASAVARARSWRAIPMATLRRGGNCARWPMPRAAADEDTTEAIGSVYRGRRVGGFGDCAIFDFSPGSALACGEGGMILTDDADLATELRYTRSHGLADRR